jgi:hypothetical protein
MSSGKGDSNHKASPFDALLKNKGNDCDRPACEDTMSALSNALNRLNAAKGNNKHQQQQAQDTTSTTKSSKNVKQGGDVEIIQTSCPPSKDQIGKSSWTLLHSMVSVFELIYYGHLLDWIRYIMVIYWIGLLFFLSFWSLISHSHFCFALSFILNNN